jgi:Domain of unknown function (DUF5069)
MLTTAPNLTTTPPRSGHEMLGRYAWLARLADKVRAEHAGTEGNYVGYCALSVGFLERAGVSKDEFDRLIDQDATDNGLTAYFDRHVSDEDRHAANRYVLEENAATLDQQDAEEGRR